MNSVCVHNIDRRCRILLWRAEQHHSSLDHEKKSPPQIGISVPGWEWLIASVLSVHVHEWLCLFPRVLGFPYEADVDYTILNDCLCNL